MLEKAKALQFASSGTAEELKLLVHHPSSEVISMLIKNSNLTGDLVLIIVNRKNCRAGDVFILISV
jgi:hypothetical protein